MKKTSAWVDSVSKSASGGGRGGLDPFLLFYLGQTVSRLMVYASRCAVL